MANSFWRGFGSVFTIFPSRLVGPPRPRTTEEALQWDADKLRGDWRRVCLDIEGQTYAELYDQRPVWIGEGNTDDV